jgi:phage shock protein E
MKNIIFYTIFSLITAQTSFAEDKNPHIRYDQFKKIVSDTETIRSQKLLSEDEFIKMSKERNTIVLDARSKDKFEAIHIEGAKHLAFTDFAEETLKKVIPNKNTRILIYCNNNFRGDRVNLMLKSAPVSLNIQTFVNLHTYGYKNVYELRPYLDLKTTKIPFVINQTN